jgi:probable phosphoglycerate mutase
MEGFASRVLDAVASIARDHPGERVLVITHGWVMDVITRHIMNLPPSAILNMKRKNGECLSLAATEHAIHALSADANLPGFGACSCSEKQERVLCRPSSAGARPDRVATVTLHR